MIDEGKTLSELSSEIKKFSMIKHKEGLKGDFAVFIPKIKALFNKDSACMQHLIYRCAQLHMEHIAQGGDPFESGSSRPLDFGHWAARKLEQLSKI